LKKILFFLVIVFLVGFVSAASVFDVQLSKFNYSVNQNFQGNIFINDSSVLVDSVVKADVLECGSYDLKEIEIYDLLINSGEDLSSKSVFSAGGSGISSSMGLETNGSSLIGFKVDNEISKINFSISGSASGVKFDVGADGFYDWKFAGIESDWGSVNIPYDYDGNRDLPGEDDYNPKISYACSNFNVGLDEFASELKLNVKGIAQRNDPAGDLKAKVKGRECTFEDVPSSYGNVECNVTLDVSDYEGFIDLEICLIATSDSFKVPRKVYDGVPYYYFGVQERLYDFSLSSSLVYVTDDVLINSMNDYCDEVLGECFIPVEVSVLNGGDVNFGDLYLEYGAASNDDFYDVDSSILEVDLSNKSIPLSSFIELKTPIVENREDCVLKVEFGSFDKEIGFGVSAGPSVVIDVSSLYMAKNFDIVFDGSGSRAGDNRSIVSYFWDFGDNKTSTMESVSHKYVEDGDYTVVLKVRDSFGIEGETSVNVFIVPLEEHLENQFSDLDNGIVNAQLLELLTGDEKEFYDFMGYNSLINLSVSNINSLESNFTSIKDSNLSNKDTKYALIVNELHGITSNFPVEVNRISSRDIDNLGLLIPDEIFNYGGISNYNSAYVNELFKFNVENVDIDMESTLFYVDFFEGGSNFLHVKKDISISGGTNLVVVEDLREIVSDLGNSVGGTAYNNTRILTWDGSVSSIEYVVEANELNSIKTIVFTDLEVTGGDTYCFADSSCEFFCGDNVCTIANYLFVDEGDETNSNYCPEDCVRETPKYNYVILISFFVLFALYILFYRGPWSAKDLINRISGKKIFVSERERVMLNQFIYNSLNRGYNKDEIKSALVKKGWSKKKVEHIMESYLREKMRKSI
jgi:PKD repeat protein